MATINKSDVFISAFKDIVKAIKDCEYGRIILKGGRNSTKSQTVATSIIMGVMENKESAICLIRSDNKIGDTLVATISESIRLLNVGQFWKLRKCPFEYVLLDREGHETDVSIKFAGCEHPENLKSFKPRRGNFRYMWVEELTNFRCYDDIMSLINTFIRGTEQTFIATYNPPLRPSNWVNKLYNAPCGILLGYDSNNYIEELEYNIDYEDTGNDTIIKTRQLVSHSSYVDVIKSGHMDWLGKESIALIEQMKINDNKKYRWMYLGEPVGTDASVFTNIVDWDSDRSTLGEYEVYRGFDWGYGGPDTSAYTEWYYDSVQSYLYCIGEFGRPKMHTDEIADEILKHNKYNFNVYADSACKELNYGLRNKGLNIIDVKKGPGSIRAGINWLKNLRGIYINKMLTPKTYKEFTEYEYIINKDNEITSELSDKNNHFIDSTRYALSSLIKYE